MDGSKAVTVNEGLRRVVKAISVLAWVWAALFVAVAIATVFGTEEWLALLFLPSAAIGFAILQGIAWIVSGFNGGRGDDDGLVWARHIFKRRTAQKIRQSEAVKANLKGVAGWLAWITFVFLVVSPAALIGGTRTNIEQAEKDYPALLTTPSWGAYVDTLTSMVWISAAMCFFVGLALIWWKKPPTVTLAIVTLWIAGPTVSYLDLVALPMHYFGSHLMNEDGAVRQLAIAFSGAIVWTLYFLRSRRVRNTYYP